MGNVDWGAIIAGIGGGLQGGSAAYGDIEANRRKEEEDAARRQEREEALAIQRQQVERQMARDQATTDAAARAEALKRDTASVDRARAVYGTDQDVPAAITEASSRIGRGDEVRQQITADPRQVLMSAAAQSPMGPIPVPSVASRFTPNADERKQRDLVAEAFAQAAAVRPTNPAAAAAMEMNAKLGKVQPAQASDFAAPIDPVDAAVKRETALLPVKMQEAEGREKIQAKYRPAQPAGMSPAQAVAARQMADDFARDSKPFSDRGQAYDAIHTASQSNTPAGDMSLIYGYMKMMDPGSVVRESEYATAQNAAGVPDRIRNAYNSVVNGSKLTPEQRKQFVSEAGALYKTAKARQDRITKTYSERATKQGLDPSFVVMDYGATSPLDDPAASPAATAAAGAPTAPVKVGDTRPIKGKPHRITKVYPDGTFDAVPEP